MFLSFKTFSKTFFMKIFQKYLQNVSLTLSNTVTKFILNRCKDTCKCWIAFDGNAVHSIRGNYCHQNAIQYLHVSLHLFTINFDTVLLSVREKYHNSYMLSKTKNRRNKDRETGGGMKYACSTYKKCTGIQFFPCLFTLNASVYCLEDRSNNFV